MTTDELRIAVAKELGWEYIGINGADEPYGYPPKCNYKHPQNQKVFPPFTTSLDACWEGWEKDAPDEYFSKHLWRVINEPFDDEYEGWIRVCKATAEQRCRAMLKWKGREV